MYVRDMVPEKRLVKTEVVEVEQAFRVASEAQDGAREEVEILAVDADGGYWLERH